MRMFSCLLKRQLKKGVLLMLFFCLILLGQTQTSAQWTHRYLPYQTAYLTTLDPKDKDAFFAKLNADVAETRQVVNAIESFAGYDGKIPEGKLDIMDILTGSSLYMDYDMAIWRDTLLRAPGRLAQTVFDDANMTFQLSQRLHNQENIETILENQKEIMRRGIRRGGLNREKYGEALAQLQNIDTDFTVADTFYVEQLLAYLEKDWYILVLLAMCIFSVFSAGNQYKISNLVLTSPMGIRRYAVKQILVSIVVVEIGLAVYYSGVFFVLTGGRLAHIPWRHPIQVVESYENILQDISVADYVFLHLAIKNLFCLCFVSCVLYISALSKNNAVSLIGTTVMCAVPILLSSLIPSAGGLFIGSGKYLFEQLCYVRMRTRLIPYSTVFAGGSILLTVVMFVVLLIRVPYASRRWVK